MQIVDFIREYWQYISIALVIVIDIIFIFIKKRPLSLDEFQAALDDMYRNLPYYVCLAEKDYEDIQSVGFTKLSYALELAVSHVQKKISRPLTEREIEKVKNAARCSIEQILDTPTKKGGLGREKNS